MIGPNFKRRFAGGERIGRWTVVRFDRMHGEMSRWICRCDCGTERSVLQGSLVMGTTGSCGCLKSENVSAATRRRVTTHGMSKTKEYHIWHRMLRRCFDPSDPAYHNYGGRGITVCPEWATSFEAFITHVGPRPSLRHSIDRYPNNNGNYEPGNVRWATTQQQNRNRRDNRFISHSGRTLTATEWAELSGIKPGTILRRLRAGWSGELAITTPVRSSERWPT